MIKQKLSWVVLCAVSLTALSAGAAEKTGEAFATVNGVGLSAKTLEQAVNANVARGVADNGELRRALQTELIVREVLNQQAVKQGLDRDEGVKSQLQQATQTILAEAVIADYMAKHPVSETDVLAEYDRQVGLLKGAQQYHLFNIMVDSEADARAVIAQLRGKAAFDKLVAAKSLDPSKRNGGDLGWLVREQLNPAVADAVGKLKQGEVSAPIKTQAGWQIVKLAEARPFVPPPFAQAKAAIEQGLRQKQRTEYLQKLVNDAKVDVLQPVK